MDWKSVTFEVNGDVKSDGSTYTSVDALLAVKNNVKLEFNFSGPGGASPDPENEMKAILNYLNTNASFLVSMAVAESVDREDGADDTGKGTGKV